MRTNNVEKRVKVNQLYLTRFTKLFKEVYSHKSKKNYEKVPQ